MDPPNKGHFGDDMNSADLLFVERFSSLGGSKYFTGIILGPVSHVLCREVYYYILCPYLGESTIGGSTVCLPVHLILLCCALGIFSEKPLDACVHN